MAYAGIEPNDEIPSLEAMEKIERNEMIVKCCVTNLILDRSPKVSLNTLNRHAKSNMPYNVFVKYRVRENVEDFKGKHPELVRLADKILEKLGKKERAAIVHEEAKRKRIREIAILCHIEQDNSEQLSGMESQSNKGLRRQESGDKRSPTSKGDVSVVEGGARLNGPIKNLFINKQSVAELVPNPRDFETSLTPTPPKETSPRSYIPKSGTITLSEDNFTRNRKLQKPFSGGQKQPSFKQFSGMEDRGFIIMRQREMKEKLSKMSPLELLKELNEHPDRASYCDDLFIGFLHKFSVSPEDKPDGLSYKTWYEALKKKADDEKLSKFVHKKDQENATQVVKKTQFIDFLPAQAPKRRNYNRKAGPVSKRSVAKNGASTEHSSAEGISPFGSSFTAKPAKPTKTTKLAPGKLFIQSRKMAQKYYAPYFKPQKVN